MRVLLWKAGVIAKASIDSRNVLGTCRKTGNNSSYSHGRNFRTVENPPWRKEFFNILLITVLESYMSRYREISELPGSIHPNCNSDLLLVTGGYLSTASTTFRSLLCPTI